MIDNISQIITACTVIITAISAMIVAYNKSKKEIKDSLPVKIQKQSNIDVEITNELERLKEAVNADVVHIYDFHNGGHYANGRSALKISCTYEVVRVPRKPRQMELQNIPISVVSTYINKLLDDLKVECSDVGHYELGMSSMYQLRTSYSVKSFFDIVLVNEHYEPIAILSVLFVTSPYTLNIDIKRQAIYRAKYIIEDLLQRTTSVNK